MIEASRHCQEEGLSSPNVLIGDPNRQRHIAADVDSRLKHAGMTDRD